MISSFLRGASRLLLLVGLLLPLAARQTCAAELSASEARGAHALRPPRADLSSSVIVPLRGGGPKKKKVEEEEKDDGSLNGWTPVIPEVEDPTGARVEFQEEKDRLAKELKEGKLEVDPELVALYEKNTAKIEIKSVPKWFQDKYRQANRSLNPHAAGPDLLDHSAPPAPSS